jgi:hypothetical protein
MDFGKLFDTIKGPALTLASTLIPGGPAILGAINAVLPDSEQLPETATGAEMRNAVGRLPPEQRGSLMEKQLDVEIAEINGWASIQKSLSEADATGNSTRPWVAKLMACIVAFVIVVFVSVWAYAIVTEATATLKELADSWPLALAIIATPTELLRYYFGKRSAEKKARYTAAAGQPIGGIAQLLGVLK